jgi:GGDEF domain-containing protein
MADRAASGPRALLVSPGDFLVLAQRALVRRGRTGADVAVIAVGVEEAAGGSACGRLAGDALLAAVAELILAGSPVGDAAAVTGNGELVILCGQLTGSAEADPIVRRVRDIMGCPVAVGGVPVRVVSASGVAMASSRQDTAEALVATAGRAMRAQRATPAGTASAPAWSGAGRAGVR